MFMGPAIWKKQKGETLYSIRCIPIGGYCAMEGEDAETENPRSFKAAAWWKRLIILIAGSFMNLITGFLIFAIFFSSAYELYPQTTVESFTDCSTICGEEKLLPGDTILELDGEKLYVMNDFSLILSLNANQQTHDIVVERNGQTLELTAVELAPHTHENEDGTKTTHYGIAFQTEEKNFISTLKFTWLNTVDNIRNVRLSLQMLFGGSVGISDLSGPVGIISQMNDVAQASATWVHALLNMLYFGGFIAVNLAVMNMLPIPALDGGRVFALLVTTAIEGITKKKIDPKYEGYIHAVGMALLLILMAVIMFKDIFTIFKG
jgi:regulator of sigma E protease